MDLLFGSVGLGGLYWGVRTVGPSKSAPRKGSLLYSFLP
jgi:hypothetical protein